jgi:hypothetical protein
MATKRLKAIFWPEVILTLILSAYRGDFCTGLRAEYYRITSG